MTNYHLIRRLEILIHLVNEYPNITKTELMRRLQNDHDIAITARTLERDFKALEDNFGIEISYDRQKNGYHIDEQNHEQVMNFLHFTGRIYLGDLLRESLKNFEDLKKSIVLEDFSDFEGIQLIQPILMAMKNRCDIGFVHENYQKHTRTKYQITPLQLREYQGRWYVVGVPKGENHIKTFGLARISKLGNVGISEIRPTVFNEQLKKFARIIGLNYNAAEAPETIELAVSKEQYKYLKSLPLHPSQKQEEDLPGGRVKLSLFLIPNYELKMELLKLGKEVEVLKPETLRNEIKENIAQTLKLYDDD